MKYFVFLLLCVFALSCGKEQKPVVDEVIDGIKITAAEKQKIYDCLKLDIVVFDRLKGNLAPPDINDKNKFRISLVNVRDTIRAIVSMDLEGEATNFGGVVQRNLGLSGNYYKVNNEWYEVKHDGTVNKL